MKGAFIHLVWVKGAFIHVTTRLARPDRTVHGSAADLARPAEAAHPTRMNGAFVHLVF
ncbi:hypothetical protein [Lentzea sp. NPDC004782]|uniref:hypothetical protein n=1 Tax=Lentzea sp. NPDC004782 TaxID=3154458 RepID=UPI0033A64B69